MTNKEWLCSLSAQEFYDQYYRIVHTQGLWNIDSRRFMIDWLDKEHTKADEYDMCFSREYEATFVAP